VLWARRMESRRLRRTSSYARKEGMGEHRLSWLRADIVREHFVKRAPCAARRLYHAQHSICAQLCNI
jgi:hypothetical protein